MLGGKGIRLAIPVLAGSVLLGLAATASAFAGDRPPVGAVQKKVVEAATLEEVQSVLGVARDDISGVSDFTWGPDEVIIIYHYYDVDEANYETDFANQVAPDLQSLYRKLKSVNRLRFLILMPNPGAPTLWKPFSEFRTDRKTIEELHWTGFVARYILEQVIRNKR